MDVELVGGVHVSDSAGRNESKKVKCEGQMASDGDLAIQFANFRDHVTSELERLSNAMSRLEQSLSSGPGILQGNDEQFVSSKFRKPAPLQTYDDEVDSHVSYAPIASVLHTPACGSVATTRPSLFPFWFTDSSRDFQREDWKLAFARTSIGITMRDGGTCRIEDSVYGAAVLIPQIARTVGWDYTFTTLTVQSIVFLALNIVIQAYLVLMIDKEQRALDLFAGQMFLCDFGADCSGSNCRGPGGTVPTPARLYDWSAYQNRNFVRDSLMALFPDRVNDIKQNVDVGEYGMESYTARFVSCFVFMISCLEELTLIFKMCRLLYKIPTKDEPWIRPKFRVGECHEHLEGAIEEVTIKVAGMPLFWKFFNVMVVVIPRLVLWKMTCQVGITFLMETTGVDDIIVNSVGLTFILTLDELLVNGVMHEEIKEFLMATEEFELYDRTTSCVGDMSLLSNAEILAKYKDTLKGVSCLRSLASWWRFLRFIMPMKLLVALMVTTCFVQIYYYMYCEESGGKLTGSSPVDSYLISLNQNVQWVSKTMYLPKSTEISFLSAVFPAWFPIASEDDPYWQMPES